MTWRLASAKQSCMTWRLRVHLNQHRMYLAQNKISSKSVESIPHMKARVGCHTRGPIFYQNSLLLTLENSKFRFTNCDRN